jgi:uncharacterized protein (TIGR04222 family)
MNPDPVAFYMVFYLVGLVILAWLGERRARQVERTLADRRRPSKAETGRGLFRTPVFAAAAPGWLTVGSLPGPDGDGNLAVAQLRGGERAVAEALLAGALAEGWLLRVAKSARCHVSGQPAASGGAAGFQRALSRAADANGTVQVREAASAAYDAARELAPSLDANLRRSVLLRPPEATNARRRVIVKGGGLLLAVGIIVLAWVSGPLDSILGACPLAMVPALILSWRKAKSCVGVEYLAWLRAATASLRSDVQRKPQPPAGDARLAVAIAGPAALPKVLRGVLPLAELRDVMQPSGLTECAGCA